MNDAEQIDGSSSEPEPADVSSLTAQETMALLMRPREVAICGHVNPDGDALGSILALSTLLVAMGHKVTKLLPKGNLGPRLYAFLDDYCFTAVEDYQATPELFIAVDLPNKTRLGNADAVFDRAHETMVIDHHPNYTGFADHYYGGDNASATGLLVWQLIKQSGQKISAKMAKFCYVALMTDTGHFAFQNTTAEAFTAASEMVQAGVDPAQLSTSVYDERSIGALTLDARLIDRIAFAGDGRVVYSWVTQDDLEELHITRDETEGLPSILRSVEGSDIAVLLREEHDKVRVNLRAKSDCDVGCFARRFDGGGHKAAAGFTFYGQLEEAKQLIIKEAEAYFL